MAGGDLPRIVPGVTTRKRLLLLPSKDAAECGIGNNAFRLPASTSGATGLLDASACASAPRVIVPPTTTSRACPAESKMR